MTSTEDQLDQPPTELSAISDFVQTLSITEDTSIDQSLLIMIASLQIRNFYILDELTRKVAKMAVDFTALQTAVNGAVAEIQTLVAEVAASNDDAQVQAEVDAATEALNNAVAAAQPAPAPEPAPVQ